MENQLKAELRIGNALKFWNNIFFVSEITELKITAKNKKLGIICEDYIEFSPITLTEDILLRLGFEKANTKVSGSNYFTNGKYSVMTKDGIFYFSLVSMQSHYLTYIRYIHELQNLFFSLTGEELTFKN